MESIVLHRFQMGGKGLEGKAALNTPHLEIDIMTGPVAQEITELLTHAFAPTRLEIINDSANHHGHAGHDGTDESHFTVVIESTAFTGLNRIERQRRVNRALGDIPGQRVHALAIKASAPGE